MVQYDDRGIDVLLNERYHSVILKSFFQLKNFATSNN